MNQMTRKEIFDIVDTDGNGAVTREELFTALVGGAQKDEQRKGLGFDLSEREFDAIWRQIDANDDGYIDSVEFANMFDRGAFDDDGDT